MSQHLIEVVSINDLKPHPNADRLDIVTIYGWQCCVGKGEFQTGDKAIYIPPDYLVPTDNENFAFLKKDGKDKCRITVRRLRGVVSQGLIIPIPKELKNKPVGYNTIDDLKIERYEPPIESHLSTSGMFEKPPNLYCPKFDVESWQRYSHLFDEGEIVIVSEKIHGSSSRFVWYNEKQYCGSRNNWMKEDEKNIWWTAFRQTPQIGEWCQANPNITLYGEVFGQVQSLKYGAKPNQVFFAAFAILNRNVWMDYSDFCSSLNQCGVPTVPVVTYGPLEKDKILQLAEGDSFWPNANHLMEGIVVRPVIERTSEEIGRVCLKIVSNRYLSKE